MRCVSHAEEACGHRGPDAHGHLEWPRLLQVHASRGRQRAPQHQPTQLQALPEHHQQPAAGTNERRANLTSGLTNGNKMDSQLSIVRFNRSSLELARLNTFAELAGFF